MYITELEEADYILFSAFPLSSRVLFAVTRRLVYVRARLSQRFPPHFLAFAYYKMQLRSLSGRRTPPLFPQNGHRIPGTDATNAQEFRTTAYVTRAAVHGKIMMTRRL